jgi:8-oxo-dGTP pyrophosphatase MutT (NUDIX family)
VTVKHPTSSVFVFSVSDGWRLGLIHHPRLGKWMLPGGHVEADETVAEAALREVREETGLTARLLGAPAPPLPSGFPFPVVPRPWWIVEQPVPADNHLGEPHVHVDHTYVAVVDTSGTPNGAGAAHPFAWYGADELGGLDVIEDTRLQAKELFARIGDLVAAGGRPEDLGAFLTQA